MTVRTANTRKECRYGGRVVRPWVVLAAASAYIGLQVWGLAQEPGQMARVKDVAAIEGIRDNQLVGYGLVVGLEAPVTARRLSFLRKLSYPHCSGWA